MKNKIISMIMSITLILSLFPATALAADTSATTSTSAYSDIQNHWAQAAIEKWSDLGIIQGFNGSFRPNDSITRGETAVIIDRVMKYQTDAKNTFSDLGQAFYTDAMLKANAAGVILGNGSTIRPTASITREEAVVILGRALGLTQSTTSNTSFSDSANISSWASGYVNAMINKDYIQGYNGAFNPKATITRAEMVTILNNSIKGFYNEAKEYTGNVTGTVIVNYPGATLKNITITGDLIISQGVGNGDVTLNNVTVTGNTIVRGGGANSIHITGNSQISNIIIQKNDDGSIRVVTADGAVVDAVVVDDGTDDIILTGSFGSVTVAADVSVKAVAAQIESVNITGANAVLNVDANSDVTALTAASSATGAAVTVAGTVGTLAANAQISVVNRGTITTAQINANGVIIDGTKPSTVTIASSVTTGPKDSRGNSIATTTPTSGGNSGGGSTTLSFSGTVTKLTTVNQSDGNTVASEENQAAITVAQSGNAVTVSGDLASLNSYASTNTAQGTHRWVGLAVNTGLSSIIGVSYNGTALTQADVDEAASVGVAAGSFVLWIKADTVVTTPITFTLSKSGYTTITITIDFADTSALTGTVTKLATVNQNDVNVTASQANQNAVTVAQSGSTVTVTGPLASLNSFTSTVKAQGTHKWVGLVVATGQSSITGVSFNGAALTTDDVAEAASVGVAAGSFVLWIKADEVATAPISFTLSQDGRVDKTITVHFVDTAVATVTNIRYEVINGDVELLFDKPSVTTGITEYTVEFSKDSGANWENCYVVGVGTDDCIPMGDVVRKITETTTYNKVRVTSCVDAETNYTENVVEEDLSFTFTVQGNALAFTVVRDAQNNYTINLPAEAITGELYCIEVTKASNEPNYYPLGFPVPYSSMNDKSEIALVGGLGTEIVDGSGFTLRKITNATTSGFTVTPKQTAPVKVTTP